MSLVSGLFHKDFKTFASRIQIPPEGDAETLLQLPATNTSSEGHGERKDPQEFHSCPDLLCEDEATGVSP